MSPHFTRGTFRPGKVFTGVAMQQGRVQVDPDWNELTQSLLRYLVEHPQAQDSLDGIVRWWRPGRRHGAMTRIRRALEALVAQGVICKTAGVDGRALYRLKYRKNGSFGKRLARIGAPRASNLGTRHYQELFDEALKRLPAHSPEWANLNESDPGVTLVQLFAWLSESLLYRANNIPESERARLRKIATRLRKRGFHPRVLIAGGSKTDRSVLATFIASKLGLSIYRIDLAAVVSQYIGETEKNLGRLFEAAGSRAAIIFFDEADALFGKRSEVKGNHDRYANHDVAWLLQRLERYDGLVILGINRKENLDLAVKRSSFVIAVPSLSRSAWAQRHFLREVTLSR